MKREWLKAVFFEPLLDVETGAGAVGELVVTMDGGDGVLFHQVSDELEEGEALGFGTGVGGMSIGIEAADIGDTDTVGVVAGAMGSDLLDGTARMDAAIGIDDIMIADVVPAEALMVATDALYGAVGIGTGGGAMDDDFGDSSHFFVGLMGLMGFSQYLILFSGAQDRSLRSGRNGRRQECSWNARRFFFDGCDGVAAYATIEWIEAIDTIDFWREGWGGSLPLPSRG